ncbi:FAD-dependent oxidoreductase [Catenuloplanes atrovinosus]|uniref:Assimilatory nitrate reductase electron transfer subunit n=1 Tax=Catenuloplanes atrovinosus TaxID=137266 RepID=A0AAE4CC29_9ACTN|nr:FAD-dependent oxidoreductase [Catenuloplanes atrovinosus]MDR7278728.1 assimilatory nitrate reductase electron transfer subunit [Catenuloplanes atrovinosus]
MKVTIIGYGMAGSRLAAELRARNADVKVTVLGAEPHRAYNRIMLSNLLAGKVGEADVEITEAAGHGVDVRPGSAVVAIDRAARTVTTACGDIHPYDHLVLATGGEAVIPAIPGLPGSRPDDPPLTGAKAEPLPDRVAVFRTLDDCRRILAVAETARTAIVLGGGLLGLEAARGLTARGLSVRVVHAVDRLMNRQIDTGASGVLTRTLEGLGIGCVLDAETEAVESTPDGVTLRLAGGRTLDADLLVLACGVRPETGLARAAGLDVGRGVLVDDAMRTSDPHVWAIGDCAEHDGVVGGLVAPAWEQARVVASRLTGEEPDAVYRQPAVVTRLKATGIDLAAMGASTGPEELVFSDPARGTYARLVIDGDRLAGAIMLGDNPAIGTVIQLFDRGTPVPSDRRALLLGRALGTAPVAVAESPALMPDAATVCQCNNVSKGALVRCWRDGARSVGDVVAATRATTGCGTCREAVCGIVDWLSSVDSPASEVLA